VEWKYFSLEQINSKEGEDWKVWEQPESETRSLSAFKGAEAARRQGDDAFNRFHFELLSARHSQGEDLSPESVLNAAKQAGVDLNQFGLDLQDEGLLARLASDHQEAVGRKVFGTPTIYFGDNGAYMKMRPATTGEDAVCFFETFRQIVSGDVNIGEIKRPS